MIWLLIQNIVTMANQKLYRRLGGGSSDTRPGQKVNIGNLVPMLLLFLTMIYSIFLPVKLGTIWFPIGLLIFLMGLTTVIIATINFATTPMNEIVSRGAYRYSRHPAYGALILIYFGISLASASWVFLLVAIVWTILFGFFIKTEERFCLERYGDAYREYMDRTPKWIGIPQSEKSEEQ